ncbi:MAG: thermonuclease family protein [Planctomycetota bacterium]
MTKPFRRSYKGRAIAFAIAFLLIVWQRYAEPEAPQGPPLPRSRASIAGLEPGEYRVERVVDGDTLKLFNGDRFRLQGVDTPETVKENTPVQPWGPEATDYTREFVRNAGNRVDITVEGEGVDQYGRYLGFVWYDGRLLNEELVRKGLAKAKLSYDYADKMKDRLRAAQDAARRDRVGIWSQ